MQVQLTRSSVAAGDDADAPHTYLFEAADNSTIEEIAQLIIGRHYLPTIAGGRATWSVVSQKPLALIAQQWTKPKGFFLLHPRDGWLFTNQLLLLHLNYHGQQDPEQVYQTLAELRFPQG
ncbi:hypothetical protein GO988_21975 [Hymenobacter sp. HMF4947]|uniref:Uncharacterized protein n=1 Tax=Hymenobacter ginkgonis TaxID=2682976 RepID=A0A7K1TKR5_9BACT|nr:hypothetical protein [Hymenobacter ginkgonis]MVN79008.1 hypothetical protein [Hymenobacter ginkgonis]